MRKVRPVLTVMPDWVVPWIAPTGLVAREALAALDRPLLAWSESEFDAEEFYAGYPARDISALERQIRALGTRPSWRIERIWQPDGEDDDDIVAYVAGVRNVAGRHINPRCLDDYVQAAYASADLADDEELLDLDLRLDDDQLDEALEWAEAAVCVLQQSLPWPFVDVLPYSQLDNRPAHRALFAYAALLRRRKPRIAGRWMRALVYLNPMDNLGARGVATTASKSPRT